MTKRALIVLGLTLSCLVFPAASYADDRGDGDREDGDRRDRDRREQSDGRGSADVTLYEISERVTFDPDPHNPAVIVRTATSPLLGFAAVLHRQVPAAVRAGRLRESPTAPRHTRTLLSRGRREQPHSDPVRRALGRLSDRAPRAAVPVAPAPSPAPDAAAARRRRSFPH